MRNLFTLGILLSIQLACFGQVATDSSAVSGPVMDSSYQVPDTSGKPAVLLALPAKSSPDKVIVHRLRPATDIPITAIGTGWSLYAFTKIYSKDKTPEEDILSLDINDIPRFDRHGATVYHPKADEIGDMLFYGSMPLPIILMLDKKMRKDAFKVAFLYLESMSITGLLYTGAVYFRDKYRPYAYNPAVPMSQRTRGGAKNSFFAGHVALVGTSTFFVAKMYNDYHPESRVKWIPFTLAGLATGTTAVMRYRGGQHFLSDILIGLGVGTLSGILVPHVHKNKEEPRLSFTTSYLGDTPQFGFVYKLMK